MDICTRRKSNFPKRSFALAIKFLLSSLKYLYEIIKIHAATEIRL